MIRTMRVPVILFLLASFSACPGASVGASPQKEQILIGLIPEQNIFRQMDRYKSLAEYLSERLGIRVKLTILSKYGDVIDRFNTRQMDGAFFGDLTTVIAYEKLGVTPVVTVVNPNGSIFVKGLIIVRNDGAINSARDMKGKIAAFVDRASVPGYVYPQAFLKGHGVRNPGAFFSEVFYTGSYDASVYAVVDGRADVGCVKDTVLNEMIASDVTLKNEIKILSSSPEIPGVTLSLRGDLDPQLRDRIRDLLLDIAGNDAGRKVLDKFGALGFKSSSIAEFRPVYDLLDELGVTVKNYNYRIR